MSTAGGLEKALLHASKAGCDCVQVFVKNQRQWHAKPLSDEQIALFNATRAENGITPVIAHAGYLINLASPDRSLRARSLRCLVDELERCAAIGVSGLVLHPGAHMGRGPATGIKRVARSLDIVHDRAGDCPTQILLETTAGQGTTLGRTFDELASIIHAIRAPERIGVCLDTCHLFAAGYDFRTRDGYDAMVDEMIATVGIARIRCIHTNDSKTPCGSHVDRHDHIGKGEIGIEGFKHFVRDERFFGLPFILETPKGKDGRGADFDKLNLKRLRRLSG